MKESPRDRARAERKKQLLVQGATFRARIAQSKQAVHAGLQPKALAKDAIGHVAPVVLGMIASRAASSPGGIDLQKVLPLLAGGYSALSQRGLIKPVMRIAGVAGIIVAFGLLIASRRTDTDDAL